MIALTVTLVFVPGAQVLRPLARKVVLLGGPSDLLPPLSAPECGHRDLPGQQK